MSFVRKILDVLNMDNWSEQPNMIEEKEEKPEHPFEEYGIPNSQHESESKEDESEKKKTYNRYEYQYKHMLFSERLDTSEVIGTRQDFMRRDYTIDPQYYTSCQHLHKLWRCSVNLLKDAKAKKFFETLEEFEELLYSNNNYFYGKFRLEEEKKHYLSKKDEILISFLERSFTDEYRDALELRTVKGRIGRIDHWFFMMEHYKAYLTPNALSVLEALKKRWTMELMPNLLEKHD